MNTCEKCGGVMVVVIEDKHAIVYECETCGNRELQPIRKRRRKVGPSEVKA